MQGQSAATHKKSQNQRVSWQIWLILSLILVYPISARAATDVLITAETTQYLGGEFRVDIMVDGVSDLYGIAFDLVYPPDALELVDADPATAGIQAKVIEGSLLNNDGTDPTHLKMALEDDVPGKLVIGLSRYGNVSGVSTSSQTLSLSVFFRSKDTGDTTFTVNQIGLRDSLNQDIVSATSGELVVDVQNWDWTGDVDQSKTIDLNDVILVLKTLSRQPQELISVEADVNEDGRIGMEEAVKGLEETIKNPQP